MENRSLIEKSLSLEEIKENRSRNTPEHRSNRGERRSPNKPTSNVS